MNNRDWKLDLFKSIGIISVFWGHVTEWFFFDTNAKLLQDYPKDSFQYYLPEFSINYVLIICVSLVFSAGMSLYWNTHKYQDEFNRLHINKQGWKKLINRFCILFAGATVINIFNIQYSEINLVGRSFGEIFSGLSDALSYSDVFHLVAVGTLLIPLFCSIISIRFLWIISLLFCILQQPTISIISSYFNYENIDSNFFSFIYNILIGNYDGDSYYPIFPWMSLFSFGFFCGYLEHFSKKYIKYFLLLVGVILIYVFVPNNQALIMNPENLWGAQIYVPSFPDYLGMVGIILIQYIFIFSFSDKLKRILGSEKSPLRVYSRAILFAFVFHSVVVYQLVSLYIEEINNSLFWFYSVQVLQFVFTYLCSYLWLKWRNKNNVDI